MIASQSPPSIFEIAALNVLAMVERDSPHGLIFSNVETLAVRTHCLSCFS